MPTISDMSESTTQFNGNACKCPIKALYFHTGCGISHVVAFDDFNNSTKHFRHVNCCGDNHR